MVELNCSLTFAVALFFYLSASAAYDFSGISTLVDVGGGYGQYIFAILDKYPNMRGVLFDLPATIKEADKETAADPTRERCDLIGGSYFEALPEGDACWVKSVIMDNADEQAITILSNCRQAVGDHGKVILVERILLRLQTSPSFPLHIWGGNGIWSGVCDLNE